MDEMFQSFNVLVANKISTNVPEGLESTHIVRDAGRWPQQMTAENMRSKDATRAFHCRTRHSSVDVPD